MIGEVYDTESAESETLAESETTAEKVHCGGVVGVP